jgi:hypothetical protein
MSAMNRSSFSREKSRHSPGMPFSSCAPSSVKRMSDPASASLTVPDTSTWPAVAIAATRAPMFTAMPWTFGGAISTWPMCTPARIRIPSGRSRSATAAAHWIASAGWSKVAKKPSPAVSISRP